MPQNCNEPHHICGWNVSPQIFHIVHGMLLIVSVPLKIKVHASQDHLATVWMQEVTALHREAERLVRLRSSQGERATLQRIGHLLRTYACVSRNYESIR